MADDTGRFVTMVDWDDAPHLSADEKAQLRATIPPHLLDARTKGIPQLGSGAIYPVPEEDIAVDDFPVPDHWPKGYALDVGWKVTAAVFGAHDRDQDVLYLWSIHKQGEAEPAIHAHAVKQRGAWLPGVIDPAANGRSQVDGQRLKDLYTECGLRLAIAANQVEGGIHSIWQRLSTGRLKVFRSCQAWFEEYRLYRRDEAGKVVKSNDHLMDATRYFEANGLSWLKVAPGVQKRDPSALAYGNVTPSSEGWMGA